MAAIDRSSPIPLHAQLRQILFDKIQAREWEAGQLIPSENALEQIYGLSRITIRQALSALVNDGYLSRQQGRGTFVTRPKFTHDPARRLALSDTLIEQGIEPGWRLLSAATAVPSDRVRQALALERGSEVHRLERLRLANDEVIGHHLAWTCAVLAPQFDRDAFAAGGSTHYLRRLSALAGSVARRSLEALPAGPHQAARLSVAEGTPLLRIERTLIAADGSPLEFMQAYYRGDRFTYRITL